MWLFEAVVKRARLKRKAIKPWTGLYGAVHCHMVIFPRLNVCIISLALMSLGDEMARAADPAPVASQTGLAAWYGGKWIGKPTANGERYRSGDLTAAHRKLPFGAFVRVTNLKNQQSAIVRINNRGPSSKRFVIDVSERAATDLGFRGAGTAPVRLDVLTGDELAQANPSSKR